MCSLSVICLACALPYMYNLVPVLFPSLHPTTFFQNVFNTCICGFARSALKAVPCAKKIRKGFYVSVKGSLFLLAWI